MKRDYIVLGTGMASFAACLALVERGIKPLVLDYGAKKPQKITTNLNNKTYLKNLFKKNKKTFFGNYFETRSNSLDKIEGIDVNNSYAFGGLANICGGVLDQDIMAFA
jgi:hypothetical protein